MLRHEAHQSRTMRFTLFSASYGLELFDFADNGLPTENRRLMQAIDQINRRFPKAISVAATGFDKTWKSRTERMSQSYTTSWNELVWVK
ncbi:MAG: DUF4113 domain-containing protein [Methylobacter sp.]